MTSLRILAVSLSWAVLAAAPALRAGDLSKYRGFQIGADLAAIAGQVRMDPSQTKVLHRRPALIQELEWRPQPFGPAAQVESAEGVVFSFYNGQLFRLVVRYDRYKTEGLTASDLVETISATYGPATTASAELILPSIYGDNENLQVLSRWEDAEYSLNLVRFSHQPSFTLVAVSKRLDTLARAAMIEAARLDAEDAPRRELELQQKRAADLLMQQEKARLANKPSFRL